MRFLAVVLCLWVGMRLVASTSLLSSGYAAGEPSADREQYRIRGQAANQPKAIFHIGETSAKPVWTARIDRAPVSRPQRLWNRTIDRAPVVHLAENATAPRPENLPVTNVLDRPSAHPQGASVVPSPVPMQSADYIKRTRRWSSSAWVFWRERGGGAALTSAGQLGGSQAGVRLDRRVAGLDKGRMPILLYGRLTAAVKVPHQGEAALGLALRPLSGRMPLTIGVERRIALDASGRNAMALVAAGGLNPTRVIGPVIAEGYAQAGMVGFARRDLFADGRMSFAVPLDKAARTMAGAAFSGGAQPGVSRLDIGPMLETRLPLGPIQPRLVVEWRQKVAGNARPGSGLAVTFASDF